LAKTETGTGVPQFLVFGKPELGTEIPVTGQFWFVPGFLRKLIDDEKNSIF
jgi:hypothetical protein